MAIVIVNLDLPALCGRAVCRPDPHQGRVLATERVRVERHISELYLPGLPRPEIQLPPVTVPAAVDLRARHLRILGPGLRVHADEVMAGRKVRELHLMCNGRGNLRRNVQIAVPLDLAHDPEAYGFE